MSDTSDKTDGDTSTPFDRFKELTRKLVSVPKKEIAKKDAAWQRKRQEKKKRRSA